MALVITITELELSINRARRQEPVVRGVLTPDLRAMAELYGRMIFDHASTVDLEQQAGHIEEAVSRWLQAENRMESGVVEDLAMVSGAAEEARPMPLNGAARKSSISDQGEAELAVCRFRSGDPGFDSCGACQ